MNLALNVKLVALDLKYSAICLSQEQTLLGHVLLDLLKSDFRVSHIVCLTVLCQIRRLTSQTGLHLINIE